MYRSAAVVAKTFGTFNLRQFYKKLLFKIGTKWAVNGNQLSAGSEQKPLAGLYERKRCIGCCCNSE